MSIISEKKWARKTREDAFGDTASDKASKKAYRATAAAHPLKAIGTANSLGQYTPAQHKALGEARLKAAAMNQKAVGPNATEAHRAEPSKDPRGFGTREVLQQRAGDHVRSANEHLASAAEHAAAAGGEWDESKHPRDENGKFG